MSSPISRLGAADLHTTFLQAVGAGIISNSDVAKKPLEIDLRPPLPHRVRLYMFNATHPPGGRTLGEHKVQLAVPGQGREDDGSFDYSDGRIVLLCGYEPETHVFILWDSAFYPRFSFSRNVQVKPQTVYQALAGKIGQQLRNIRGHGTEVVLTANARLLPEAIRLRMEIARRRMMTTARQNDEFSEWLALFLQAEKDNNQQAITTLMARAPKVPYLTGIAPEDITDAALRKCVFAGTIDGERVLLSAETGQIVAKITEGKRPKEMADSRGLNLIPRRDALREASAAYGKAWQEANLRRLERGRPK